MYILQVLAGFGLAGIFVALLLWFNVANLWTLISRSPEGWIAVIMLVMFNGVVFAGVQFAISVMRLAEDDDTGGGKRQPQASAEPVRVMAEAGAGDAQRVLRRR
jgi:hypothetical protein